MKLKLPVKPQTNEIQPDSDLKPLFNAKQSMCLYFVNRALRLLLRA
ncbi:hypothetical protein [Pontibacter arcticus]|nr:hypothetical protein [Pontibacter arcticus]